ncbi:MAG: phasin family protein [Thermoanaerobaculia bacterium]|nr:phasin family protein [Thermoanaerobaculia bacterium]
MEERDESGKRLQDEIKDSASRIWLAGLGALKVTEEEGSKLFNTLVEEGERFAERGRGEAERAREAARDAGERVKSEAAEGWSRVGDRIEKAVAEALAGLGVPTREEVEELSERVEDLTAAVERLQRKSGEASGQTGDE